MNIIQSTGIFIYPLALLSFLTCFIIIERLLALRQFNILPPPLLSNPLSLNTSSSTQSSLAASIISFFLKNNPTEEQLKAYARLQSKFLERGLFILEIVVAGAPLLGLLGTIVGLIKVFSGITSMADLPETSSFVQGIALALTTTMLGLVIAIPALVANSYFSRKIDLLASQLELLIEALLSSRKS